MACKTKLKKSVSGLTGYVNYLYAQRYINRVTDTVHMQGQI